MVFLTLRLLSQRSMKSSNFIDSLRLTVMGGAGGMGQPKYGGIGGRGGCVVLEANEDMTLFQVLKRHPAKLVKASVGENSHAHRLVGEPGADRIVQVPTGITVYAHSGVKIGELNQKGDRIVVARGGLGGQEITSFNGLKGEDLRIVLDLKLIADVGLVGFPNAGKSSLLRAISKAKPRVADYPFTTLKPQLGTIEYDDLRRITMADLPGLIEGAHRNAGLGHKFLKHIERTSMLLLVVDINGFRLGPQYPHRNALETIALLNKELELYGRDVLSKPAVLLVNKMDTPRAESLWKELQPAIRDFSESVRSLPEAFQPEQVLNFEHIVHMSVQKDDDSVRRLAVRIRELLDVFAQVQLTAGHSDRVALEIRQKNQQRHIESAKSEHQTTVLV